MDNDRDQPARRNTPDDVILVRPLLNHIFFDQRNLRPTARTFHKVDTLHLEELQLLVVASHFWLLRREEGDVRRARHVVEELEDEEVRKFVG